MKIIHYKTEPSSQQHFVTQLQFSQVETARGRKAEDRGIDRTKLSGGWEEDRGAGKGRGTGEAFRERKYKIAEEQ